MAANKKIENKTLRWTALILRSGAAVYLAVLALLMVLETRLVYPGAGPDCGDWNHPNIELEEVSFLSEDGTELHGYFFPHADAKGTLLFCHGNGENIAMNAVDMEQLRSTLQVNVLTFDYRGFGISKGSPSEKLVLADAEAAMDWLAERTETDPSDMIFFERSLGGGVATYLASRYQPRLLVLDRTFSSTVDVAAARYWMFPVRLVMRNRFNSAVRIKNFEGSLLQLNGDQDTVIPLWSGQRLFEAATCEDKEWIVEKGLGHIDPWPASFLAKLKSKIP